VIFSLLVGGSAFIVALILGRPTIARLRERNVGKSISADGPSTHSVKEGTPTMGGLIIYGTVALVTAVTNVFEIEDGSIIFERRSIVLPLAVVVTTMAIGFWDDLGTLTGGGGHGGLSWRIKIAMIMALAVVVALVLFFGFDVESVNIPWAGQYELGYVYIAIAVVTVFATTSAVSITDGLDGLLAGTAALAFAAYAVIAFVQGQAFLATFSFTVVGALLGFLWYNAWPASVFMGDTGALPLGASLATVALMTGHWLLLPVVGIVFVVEAVSDVLQIAYFQTTGGQRLFRMTPFHHHLELLGWSEPQVVMRLYLLGIAGAMVGIALALSV
jgi:phospho-N-acetylmuramoyl-pentapeptide-transferase